jgi:hypothetical protein
MVRDALAVFPLIKLAKKLKGSNLLSFYPPAFPLIKLAKKLKAATSSTALIRVTPSFPLIKLAKKLKEEMSFVQSKLLLCFH